MDYPILMTAKVFPDLPEHHKITLLLNYASNMMVLLPMIKPLEPMCLAEYLISDREEWILISKLMMIPYDECFS